MTTFGHELKALREWRRISQSKLGEAAGFDHSYVSRLESGARVPTREAVLFLAESLNASPEERDRLLASAGFTLPADPTGIVLLDVTSERRRLDDPTALPDWDWNDWAIELGAEMYPVMVAVQEGDTAKLRQALIRTAAVSVRIVEAIDAATVLKEGQAA